MIWDPSPTILQTRIAGTLANIFPAAVGAPANIAVTLVSSPTDPNNAVYDVTFTGTMAGIKLQALKLDGGNTSNDANLTGVTGTTSVITAGAGNEVQHIAMPVTAGINTTGTFSMVYLTHDVAGQTFDVTFDPDPDQMVAKIQAGLDFIFGAQQRQGLPDEHACRRLG